MSAYRERLNYSSVIYLEYSVVKDDSLKIGQFIHSNVLTIKTRVLVSPIGSDL